MAEGDELLGEWGGAGVWSWTPAVAGDLYVCLLKVILLSLWPAFSGFLGVFRDDVFLGFQGWVGLVELGKKQNQLFFFSNFLRGLLENC